MAIKTKIDELENGLQTSRNEGDGTEWLIEADENGKIFKRAIGSDEKIYINSNDNDVILYEFRTLTSCINIYCSSSYTH